MIPLDKNDITEYHGLRQNDRRPASERMHLLNYSMGRRFLPPTMTFTPRYGWKYHNISSVPLDFLGQAPKLLSNNNTTLPPSSPSPKEDIIDHASSTLTFLPIPPETTSSSPASSSSSAAVVVADNTIGRTRIIPQDPYGDAKRIKLSPSPADDHRFPSSTATVVTNDSSSSTATATKTAVSSLSPSAATPTMASHTSTTHNIVIPKAALYVFYGKRPRRTQLSNSNYHTWDNGAKPHELKFTSLFVCPVTKERFAAGRYGDEGKYKVVNDIYTLAQVVWFSKKTLAEHGAAARAFDCLNFRDGSSQRFGDEVPFLVGQGPKLPSIPEKIKQELDAAPLVVVAAGQATTKTESGGGGGGGVGTTAISTAKGRIISRSLTGHEDLLRLFLGLNDKFRVPPQAWEYLTIRDLRQLPLISKKNRENLKRVEYTRCRDGKDYLVPFPGFPGLLSTPTDLKIGAGLFQHQLASLEVMHRAENSSRSFGALRGGILGDAPGLGKTITMLGLIASTVGVRPINPPEFWDSDGIEEGWKLLRSNVAFKENILGALKPIRSWVNSYIPKSSRNYGIYQEVTSYVSPPFTDGRLSTIREFELHVTRNLRPFVPSSQLELFRENIVDLKAGLDKRNRKLLMSEEGRRLSWERRLVPSCGTLIVVPDALLEHWCLQIRKHLNLKVFAEENEVQQSGGIVYLDGIGDLVEIEDGRKTLRNVSFAVETAQPWQLSQYAIVITTFSRCNSEFQREVAAGRMEGIETAGQVGSRRKNKRGRDAVESDSGMHSPLLRMRWFRVVVDEGHELGTHDAGSSVASFINQIAAERRWVLSGTPTTGDEDDQEYSAKALDQLQRLLFFLRHPKYGNFPSTSNAHASPYLDSDQGSVRTKKARDTWTANVKNPFLAKKDKGKEELLCVLKEIMVMHRKEDINLPKPIFRQIEIDVLIPGEVESALRNDITSNITLVSKLDHYLHSSEFQSLVDQSQAEYIVKTVREARQALLDRGGHLQVEDELTTAIAEFENMGKDDLRPIKAVVYSSETANLLSVADWVIRMLGFESVAELSTSAHISDISSELNRFRHGFKECRTCPVCQRENEVKGNIGIGGCTNTLLEVVTLSSPRIRMLVEPERICRTYNVPLDRLGGEALSSYSKSRKFWRVGDQLEIDIRDPHSLHPKRASEEVWRTFGSDGCRHLAEIDAFQGRDWYFGPLPFDGTTDRIEVVLSKWQTCGRFHSHGRWYQGPRLLDKPVERIKEDVFVLSLDAGLSHGLDLSFVTHIFLLEPIEDAALLEQVTSRAHRLGATGPVVVETVNTFFKASEGVQVALRGIEEGKGANSVNMLLPDKEKTLRKVVCQHCYRQFDSITIAEKHEQTNCPRNPENVHVVDPFHVSSVYREIRPPLAPTAETTNA
jgi:hypothetical protein